MYIQINNDDYSVEKSHI